MLCGICKAREATVFYTEIMNGTKKEQYLCEECAAKSTSMRLKTPFGGREFSLGGLLSGLFEEAVQKEEEGGDRKPAPSEKDLVCPECGMTYAKFREDEILGCPSCYQNFGRLLLRSVRASQGADTHTGRRPKHLTVHRAPVLVQEEAPVLDETQKLCMQLEQAVEREDYELAARLRDVLRERKEQEAGCVHE